MTLKSEYDKRGTWMFHDWKYPKKLSKHGSDFKYIMILGILTPKYGCVIVLFKYCSGFEQESRMEDIDTFMNIFGGCEL